MKNYIHVFKCNKEIAIINDIKDLHKYRDADYYFYESKHDYKFTNHNTVSVYPSDYNQFKKQFKSLLQYLNIHCHNTVSIDINDVSGNGFDLSISIDGNTYQYIKSVNFPVDHDIIDMIVKEWNEYVRQSV